MGKWQHVFKEELEPTDRMNVPPVSLKLKEGFINPTFCSKPFDTPFHLRTMYDLRAPLPPRLHGRTGLAALSHLVLIRATEMHCC